MCRDINREKSEVKYQNGFDLYRRASQNSSMPEAKVQSCCLAARHGEAKALELLIEDNLGYIGMLASTMRRRCYKNTIIDRADLAESGVEGLIKAVHKFDPSKGGCFRVYAREYIVGAMLKQISDMSPVGSFRRAIKELVGEVETLRETLSASLGHEVSAIAAMEHGRRLGRLSDGDCELYKNYLMAEKSVSIDDDENPVDLPSVEDEAVEEKLAEQTIRNAVAELPEREREAIERFYGLNNLEPESLSSIGNALNVTKGRVKQLRDQGERRLGQRKDVKDILYAFNPRREEADKHKEKEGALGGRGR